MPGIPCGVCGVDIGIDGAGGLGGASDGPGGVSFQSNIYESDCLNSMVYEVKNAKA